MRNTIPAMQGGNEEDVRKCRFA